MSPLPSVQLARDRQRHRILEAFEERAARNGPRDVVMAELARDLGISTRTLYQQFGSKAEIVREVLERWAAEHDDEPGAPPGGSVQGRVMEATERWVRGQDRFSTEFWRQIHRDYPEARRALADRIERSQERMREHLAPHLRPEVNVDLALSLLRRSLGHALDPERCNGLGLSRQEAVRQTVSLWCRGALRPGAP